MQTPITILKSGYLLCLSKSCAFRKECAIHETAGDFREDDGFTPVIKTITNTIAECKTADELAAENCSPQLLPASYNKLWRGMIKVQKQ